jgi:glycosyltransferase involved in cell wall biosynthesis
MEIHPWVTVVTPSLNSGRYIRNAIESVLSQDYARIEYIVIDGGSTDGTLEILGEYSSRLWHCSMPDHGVVHAINKGFERARGTIFSWLSADDSYLPGAISSAVKHLANPKIDVVYGNAHWIDQNNARIGAYPTQPFQIETLARECIISQPASFIRASAFQSMGMLDVDQKLVFDYDLWIRLARQFQFEYVPEFWANSRMHSSSITLTERRRVLKANMALLEKHYSYVPLQWIYGYCSHLLDERDQFFQPLRHSTLAYVASLVYGLARNRSQAGRFLGDWISAPLRPGALKHYWRSRRDHSQTPAQDRLIPAGAGEPGD